MGNSAVERPRGIDLRGAYVRIAEHARLATGANLVLVTALGPDRSRATVTGVAANMDAPMIGTFRAIKRVLPLFDPRKIEFEIAGNPVQEAALTRGAHVTASFAEAGRDVVPDIALRFLSRILGLSSATARPLMVREEVAGAVWFVTVGAPSASELKAYDSFATQASLTVESAFELEGLRHQVEELREARRLLSAGSEAVRRDIAETLHGTVQSQLLVADINLKRALDLIGDTQQEARTIIESERSRIEGVRERDIRQVGRQLHPSVIRLGIGPALRSLADRFRPLMDVLVDVDRRLDGLRGTSEQDLTSEQRLLVYRVVEEALGNAHKHGHANRARVSLSVTGGSKLTLSVMDDGDSVEGSEVHPGLGLAMIATMVDEAGGEWSLDNGTHGGAILSVEIPVESLAAVRTPIPLGPVLALIG